MDIFTVWNYTREGASGTRSTILNIDHESMTPDALRALQEEAKEFHNGFSKNPATALVVTFFHILGKAPSCCEAYGCGCAQYYEAQYYGVKISQLTKEEARAAISQLESGALPIIGIDLYTLKTLKERAQELNTEPTWADKVASYDLEKCNTLLTALSGGDLPLYGEDEELHAALTARVEELNAPGGGYDAKLNAAVIAYAKQIDALVEKGAISAELAEEIHDTVQRIGAVGDLKANDDIIKDMDNAVTALRSAVPSPTPHQVETYTLEECEDLQHLLGTIPGPLTGEEEDLRDRLSARVEELNTPIGGSD